MANPYYTASSVGSAGSRATAAPVNTQFTGVESGFDLVDTQVGKVIRFTEAQTELADLAAVRAGRFLTWDDAGDPILTTIIGESQGAWAGSTAYNARDVVSAPQAEGYHKSLYWCNTSHTSSGTFAADVATKWTLMIDMEGTERLEFEVKSADFTAVRGGSYMVSVTSTAVTVTLPAAPALGDSPVTIVHYKGTLASNNITIDPNSLKIETSASNVVLSSPEYVKVAYTYTGDAAVGWINLYG